MSTKPNELPILVTGAAGFVGAAVVAKLQQEGFHVLGIDNFNDYYSPKLKCDRYLNCPQESFTLRRFDLRETERVETELKDWKFQLIIHLAAQPGVRYSLENPREYFSNNLDGFFNVIETARKYELTDTILYASSSSVYGARSFDLFRTTDQTDCPESFYAATKKANEVLAYSYAKNFGLNLCGLRFFTVYGPWGRPDMAPWLFTEKVIKDEPITLFNKGEMHRDFTYIDDIVNGIVLMVQQKHKLKGHQLFNLGRGEPVHIGTFVKTIEKLTGKKAEIIHEEAPHGDVPNTFADIAEATKVFGYKPTVDIETGLKHFTEWYQQYHTTDYPSYTEE